MKKIYFLKKIKIPFLLLLLFISFSFLVKAQVNTYGFTQNVGTYTAISGGTSFGTTTTDDQRFVDIAVPAGGTATTGVGIPIGFNFSFNGNVFDRLAINANGWISLGKSALTPSVNIASSSSYTPLASTVVATPTELRSRIAGIGRDIQAQAGAEIRMETIGTSPNQVCVIQWTNYKKFGGGGTGDNLNFQIRLNETSNVVEVVYGTIIFNATSNTADVGLGGTVATNFNNRTTATDWNATTGGALNTNRCTMLNTVTVPVSGRTFVWTPPVPCTGTPNPGNTLATANPACSGVNFILSLQNNPAVSGLTYQWQSSPDGITWTNIAAATSMNLSISQTATTWYRCNVTCSGNTATSTALEVTMNIPTNCYCIPPNSNCNLDDVILNVTMGGINNSSTCGANGYTNYASTVAPASVIAGGTYPMSVSVGPGGTEYVGVWIDFNVNGIFEASEFTALGNGNGVTISGSIVIPSTATLGTTRMRVRDRYNTALTGANACLGYAFGETEDYAITINPCIPVTITTQPVNRTIACGGDATFTIATAGSLPVYKWQQRVSATALWVDISNGGLYSGATTNMLTISGAPVSMSGYQYRTVYSGACRAIDYSSIVTLTVTTLVANVNPASANICNGAIQQLTLTNITSPQPASTNVASGPITVSIPDNSQVGTSTTLTVAGVPAASVITGISVKLNLTHTWAGDLVFVLKAPNGQILNLDYYISGTGAGPSTGFVNTVISSAGTALLSTGASPYTGTFRADASTAGGASPAGPTGFAPTTNTWTALYTTGGSANGTWTLAMYDGGPADIGDLTSWDITINYLAGIPATGVWEPTTPTNTIFTDAAATIPYVAGTPANSVYVLPTATTTYTVVVTTPTCVSGVTNIPVTVSNPVGAVTSPTNKTICTNGSTSFTVSAASGNAIAYQWQLSTDAGATWTNVSNSGVHSGATTATLTLTNVPVSMHNNQYRAVLTVSTCSSVVNSAAATLTVNPLPVATITAAPTTALYPGITTVLTANVSPNAAATYQWFRNGVAVNAATSGTLEVNIDQLGEYSVTVVDVNGCGGSSAASITITAAPNDILFIYPSPNTGQFQVRYQSLEGNITARSVTIYDAKGSRVYAKTFSIAVPYGRMDVDLSNHGRGIYRVELGDQNGKRIKVGSVIVL